MNNAIVRFIAAFVVYAVVDIVWNFLPFVMGMYEALHEASGSQRYTSDAFVQDLGNLSAAHIVSLLAFFALIAFANSYLAIGPAIRANDLMKAVKNSLAIGCAAYATYVAPTALLISDFPMALVPIDIVIGGCLSLVTSVSVTYVALRVQNRDSS